MLTGKSGLAPLLSIIATTATERLTRIAKAAEKPMHIMKHCKWRLPKVGASNFGTPEVFLFNTILSKLR